MYPVSLGVCEFLVLEYMETMQVEIRRAGRLEGPGAASVETAVAPRPACLGRNVEGGQRTQPQRRVRFLRQRRVGYCASGRIAQAVCLMARKSLFFLEMRLRKAGETSFPVKVDPPITLTSFTLSLSLTRFPCFCPCGHRVNQKVD